MKIIEITTVVLSLVLMISAFNSFGFIQNIYNVGDQQVQSFQTIGNSDTDVTDKEFFSNSDKNGTLVQKINYYMLESKYNNNGVGQESNIYMAGNDIFKTLNMFRSIIWQATFGLSGLLQSLGLYFAFANMVQMMAILSYAIGLLQMLSGRSMED